MTAVADLVYEAEKAPIPIHEIERASDSSLNVPDPALDRRITRSFDVHILPWLFGIWLGAFIDRSNIGNAKLDGLTTDLKLDGTKFNVALAVFYVLYILYDIPSNLVLKKIGGGRYLPALMVLWGVLTIIMGAVKTYAGLLICRILLGFCEGGLFGGIILYLSMFYPRHQLLTRLGVFYCAAPLSGAFGGLLATGLAEINYHGYNSWPWIFFIEGAITVVFGLISMLFLPNTPGSAKFLTAHEQAVAVHRLVFDQHGAAAASVVEQEKNSFKYMRMAIFNINTIVLSVLFLCILIPIYSYSLFLPTIISGLGYKRVTAQLFTVPPNALGFISVLVVCYFSDKIKMRGPIMIGGCSLAIVGYIMNIASSSAGVRYAGTFLIAAGIFPCSPTSVAWLSNNLAPHYVRATGIGFMVAFGNCGAFIATFTYLPANAPRYIQGHSINLAFLVLCVILAIVTMIYAKAENTKRENGGRDGRLTGTDQADLGYRHPGFRYTL